MRLQCSRSVLKGQVAYSMAFRIETAARGRFSVFTLSGRIDAQAIAELERLFELQTDYRDIVVDLKDVSLVDREAMRFFGRCEADGVRLENTTPYIREWMEREKD
jgi:STAS domain-containing protein